MSYAYEFIDNSFQPKEELPDPISTFLAKANETFLKVQNDEGREWIRSLVVGVLRDGKDPDAATLELDKLDSTVKDTEPVRGEQAESAPVRDKSDQTAPEPQNFQAGPPPQGDQADQPDLAGQGPKVYQSTPGAQPAASDPGKAEAQKVEPPQATIRTSKITIEIKNAESKNIGDLEVHYAWVDGVVPTKDEVNFLEELQKSIGDMKRISVGENDDSYFYKVLDILYPAKLDPGPAEYRRLLERTCNVGRMCLGQGIFDQNQARLMLRNVLGDSVASYGMRRRFEIAFRFGSALVTTLMILAFAYVVLWAISAAFTYNGYDSPFSLLGMFKYLIIYFCGISITAWASYMQRSMSLDATISGSDVEDLRTLLADNIHPSIRTFYLFTFALMAALLLDTGIVTIDLGTNLMTRDILSNAKTALICGLFLGLAERALPSAMGEKATLFLGNFAPAKDVPAAPAKPTG
jgi:hypothetical protein